MHMRELFFRPMLKRGGVGGVWVQGEQGEGVKKERAKRYSGPNRVYKGGGVNLMSGHNTGLEAGN